MKKYIIYLSILVVILIIICLYFGISALSGGGVLDKNVTIYVADQGDNTISVINGSTSQLVATIRLVGGVPGGMLLSPNGQYLYVGSNSGLYVINTTTERVVKTIINSSIGSILASDQDGRYIYTGNPNVSIAPSGGFQGKSTIAVINTSNLNVIRTVPLNAPNLNGTLLYLYIGEEALTNDGSKLYVAGTYGYEHYESYLGEVISSVGFLWILNSTTGSIIRSLNISNPTTVESGTVELARSSTGDYIYAVTTWQIFNISTQNGEIVSVKNFMHTFPYVSSLALSPDYQTMYVSNFYAGQGHYATSFTITNLSSGSSESINLSALNGMAVTPDGKLLYATENPNKLIIISATNHNVLKSIEVGSEPTDIVVYQR